MRAAWAIHNMPCVLRGNAHNLVTIGRGRRADAGNVMRERSLGEFEAIFERASIPVLQIPEVPLARVSVVLNSSLLDSSVLLMAGYFKRRFRSEVLLHWSPKLTDLDARAVASRDELQPAQGGFKSTDELLGQIADSGTELIVHPVLADADDRTVDVDRLVEGARPPVLLMHTPIDSAEDVFRRVLHSLTGNFRQKQNFAYSFRLVEEGGRLLLLHTIDAVEVDDVRDSLRVAHEVSDRGAGELLQTMAHHGERYLKGVIAASQDMDCDVSYRLALGAAMPLVQAELEAERYGLLVVGHHRNGRSHVGADEYQMMHRITQVPVLAL